MSRPTRRRPVAIAAATCALAAAGVLAVTAAGHDEPAPPVPDAQEQVDPPRDDLGRGLGIDLADLPDELLADLGALRELPPGEQLGALADLRAAAAAGDYGPQVQAGVQQVGDELAARTAGLADRLPEPLRELGEDGYDDEIAVLEDVRDQVLDDGRGEQLQTWADELTSVFG